MFEEIFIIRLDTYSSIWVGIPIEVGPYINALDIAKCHTVRKNILGALPKTAIASAPLLAGANRICEAATAKRNKVLNDVAPPPPPSNIVTHAQIVCEMEQEAQDRLAAMRVRPDEPLPELVPTIGFAEVDPEDNSDDEGQVESDTKSWWTRDTLLHAVSSDEDPIMRALESDEEI